MFLNSAFRNVSVCCNRNSRVGLGIRSFSNAFRISPSIASAIANGSPVIALESAIITHGMPYPHNVQTALRVEEIIREGGAIPATVGVLKGQLTVGLTKEEIEDLGKPMASADVIKVSRRDIPVALSRKINGGTTISGTIIAAAKAKIPIFVTGGLGGVHRGAELTFDVSADLTELGRNQIAVISAGVKSILDIAKTLEYLETQGVCVSVLNRDTSNNMGKAKFPSFFTAESPYSVPYGLTDEVQAAKLIHSTFEFALGSGLLIAVPIPKAGEACGELIENAIRTALAHADTRGIKGREITPFVLSHVNELTAGASLNANKILIFNNAKVGAKIAVEYAKLRNRGNGNRNTNENSNISIMGKKRTAKDAASVKFNIKQGGCRPVVIGGSSLDLIFGVKESEIVEDGRTHQAKLGTVPGGVGRNMAEALSRLGHAPLLISAIGDDLYGQELLNRFSNLPMDKTGLVIGKFPTAIYSAILSKSGECLFGLGQMEAHDTLSPEELQKYEQEIKLASLVIIDGNIPVQSMTLAMKICTKFNVPVWFEPTELRKAGKLLQVPREYWSCLSFISPNKNELLMLSGLKGYSSKIEAKDINFGIKQCFEIFPSLQLILLTHGKNGFSTIYRNVGSSSSEIENIDYPAPALEESTGESIISVSGAGDCLNSGFIAGLLQNKDLNYCALEGTRCAKTSLLSHFNVPETLSVN